MPDIDGLAFSVGRRAKGVAGHFDAPNDVREFLAHCLMMKGTYRRHNIFRLVRFRTRILTLDAEVHDKIYFS